MPEHLRALVVVLVLAGVIFFITRRATIDLVPANNFTRWRNTWFSLTIIAFISHSAWLYFSITSIVLFLLARQENNRVALFLLALFLIPNASVDIPGFGVVKYILELNHVRLLTIIILLPATFLLQPQPGALKFGRLWSDKILAMYLLLSSALLFRDTTITDGLRGVVNLTVDIFLPYYTISRLAINYKTSREAVVAFLIAILVIAAIGIFESIRHWLLFSSLVESLGLKWGYSNYLSRGGGLRALATTGHPIALGYVIAVGIGFYLYIQNYISAKNIRRLLVTILIFGLIAPISKAPWIGTLVIFATFIFTGPNAKNNLIKLSLFSVILILIFSQFEFGRRILDFLPFIGSIEKGNIDYRQQLLNNSIIIIERNFWVGSTDYLKTPEMQAIMQGQGIIDIVNTYLEIALDKGILGLSLFAFFFLSVLSGVHRAMRQLSANDNDMRQLGRSLFATLVGILVMIFTVSSITIIPIVYWSIAGLGVAYIQMVAQREKHNLPQGLSTRTS